MTRISRISVIVLTKNEEAGLGNTLQKLRDFDDVIVVDSLSDDRTVEIAESHGARVVNFAWNGEYPKKKQWALENAGAENNWVLLLDADEFPSVSLVDELRALQPSLEATTDGAYDINLLYRFAGKYLRYGHVVTKRSLLHVDRSSFPVIDDLDAPGIREVEGHYQPEVTAPIGKLKHRIVHDDRDPVSSWFARHNRYSDWEAHLRMNEQLRKEIANKRTLKGKVFDAVPFKPVLFFGYAYVARAGFLDGRAGFDYATALATYYWQIGVKTREAMKSEQGRRTARGHSMRVVHVIPSVARSEGGPSEVVRKLKPALHSQGVDVRIVTTNKDARPSDMDLLGQPDVRYARNWLKRWTLSPGMVSILWREIGASDLVHVHSVHTFPSTVAMIIARLRGRNVLLQPHGALNAYHLNQRRALKLAYLRIVDRWGMRAVAAALYSSTIEARDAGAVLHQIPRLRLPLGIDEQLLDQPRSQEQGSSVLFLARLAKKKRVDLFIRALACNPLSEVALEAVIAGPVDADLPSSPAEMIRAAGIGHRVRLVGQVGAEERARLFANSAVYVLPSDDESFGMSVAEAMGSGCAVITTPNVGVAIDASDARAAVIVAQDPASIATEIAALLSDPVARSALSDRARKYARDNLTWDRVGKLLADYYRDYAPAHERELEGHT